MGNLSICVLVLMLRRFCWEVKRIGCIVVLSTKLTELCFYLFDLEHRLPFLSFNDSFHKFFGIMDILLRLDEKKNAKFVI